MNTIIAEQKLLAAFSRNIPPAADQTYKLRDQALAYNRNKKQWEGLYIVVDFSGRNVKVTNIENLFLEMSST